MWECSSDYDTFKLSVAQRNPITPGAWKDSLPMRTDPLNSLLPLHPSFMTTSASEAEVYLRRIARIFSTTPADPGGSFRGIFLHHGPPSNAMPRKSRGQI